MSRRVEVAIGQAIASDPLDRPGVWLVDVEYHRATGEPPAPVLITGTPYKGKTGIHLDVAGTNRPPCPFAPDALVVCFDAPAVLGCFLSLGWPLPARILDLHAEFRCLTAGLGIEDDSFQGALAYFGLASEGPDALEKLLAAMQPRLDVPRALLRGRYTAAVARMEGVGVPIDMDNLVRLRDGWEVLRDVLVEQVDQHYGVFQEGKFNPRRWAAWLNRNHIPWPRTAPGRLDLRQETFRDMAAAYPQVRPMKELRATLSQLRLFRLAVGADGRNRTPLRPFASKTGRNQPSTASFIFGPATWLRGLIKPAEGMALAYVDYEQQEFGIAAALSGDPGMQAAYRSGDPYLTFAKQAGAVPADATKESHREERERFKLCALGVQYGMGAKSLAARLRVPLAEAREHLQLHRRTYPTYWRWSREVERRGFADGKLQAAFGWTMRVGPSSNRRSVRNFPLQANGAEMLRLACCFLTEAGVRVCAPVHDALLIEAPIDAIDHTVAACQQRMQWASEAVLPGFPLRTEAKVVWFPDRYMDERGRAMWTTVFQLLEETGRRG